MFVLSIVRPVEDGAAFGKATVFDALPERKNLHTLVYRALREHNPHMPMGEASRYAAQIMNKDFGAEVVEASTGLRFRVDPSDNPPNICPCCGALVRPGDHAHAGQEDAYCLGCFTWKRGVPACLPANSAPPNPWTTDTEDARWCMEIVFEPAEGETDSGYRYSSHPDAHKLWGDEDNALIAWPGLVAGQILSVTITEVAGT